MDPDARTTARRLAASFVPRRLGGIAGISVATGLLFLASWIAQPQSLSHSAILGMLPFAAVLGIVAVGQTLVVQQGGIDLSVPGVISLTVIIMTVYPNEDNGKVLTAFGLAVAAALAAGLVNGIVVSLFGVSAIIATLGMNALLYGGDIQISGGTPTKTTPWLQRFTSSDVVGIPTTVVIAIAIAGFVAFVVKRTVLGRQFEAAGASASVFRTAGFDPRRYQLVAYVSASLLYCVAGTLLAGVVSTPSAFQGEEYLLPSIAAVVIGGTSLAGGPGSAVASCLGALFLTQLQQLIITTGADAAVQYLVQAAAIAAGVAVYQFAAVRLALARLRTPTPGAAPIDEH